MKSTFARIVLLAMLLLASLAASAQNYPARPVKTVVLFLRAVRRTTMRAC